ncbi:2-nitropropane dioxygenase [Enterococcus plantarum]|uniref:Probable nitronate monooxygenase n=1 Tax=Enterococcus plantarum TaxID=1077675 RepID=A0A2W3Z3D1_9ENTE|nr:enoyl-[acyl-carrier-protein] reductase FabK [Enterococcus plantarum]MBO0424037.1 enoyl-[acyl-carrier-protein] reductase FabK [Enterococcus plantarum]MBO0467403.1 enoyl-[acyl-carrier-protein] reductase FabK [Enterococcus plantarum]OEG19771.1 2-nitropropane dioxygenase [Enterococcus plantarum]PZL74668.1 enoyl-[acyl-carrier-protein] reductase FabK [Enterococcus plantarum]
MQSKIGELIGIEYPIFQGGMAWIADASLAGAVSEAGGLGIIAGGNAPKEVVQTEIKKIKEITDKPFGVNIMLLSPFAQDIVDLVCEENVPVVTTGAGNPSKYMARFKEHNIKVIPVVPSVALGARMEKIGADAVIVEGMEAGGHIGKLTTMSIVPQVVDALTIPVIAAGGIGDGRGMAAVLMLGADAVQVGTRFLVAKECTVHENYKARIIKARDIDTTVTCQHFGHPVRAIKNKLTNEYDRLEKIELKKANPDLVQFDELGQGALRKAVVEGDVDHGSIMAGQIAGLVTKEETAKEIIESYISETKEVMAAECSRWL